MSRAESLSTQIRKHIAKIRLKNWDFSIVSSNCIGGSIYQRFNLPYTTPFVGLYIFAPCYIRLLRNLSFYLSAPLNFVDVSRYESANQDRVTRPYPIGLLGEDIEIHFVHYSSPSDAREKWDRRLARINWNNLFYVFTDRDNCTPEMIAEFENLPFFHKVCFTAKAYPNLRSTVWIEECSDLSNVPDLIAQYRLYKKYFDEVEWLNGGTGRQSGIRVLLAP